MRELKKQLVMRWDELLMFLAAEMAMFLIGEIMLAVIVRLEKNGETLIELGTIMAVMVFLFIFIFAGMSTMAACFNIGVSMGSVRRRLFPMYLCGSYVEFLLVSAEVVLLHHLESFIIQAAYPGIRNEFDMGRGLQWNYILTAGLAAAALNMFFGALFLKYGKISFFIVWLLFVSCTGCTSRIAHSGIMDADSGVGKILRHIVNFLTGITENEALFGLLTVSCIIILISWLMLRKQQIHM